MAIHFNTVPKGAVSKYPKKSAPKVAVSKIVKIIVLLNMNNSFVAIMTGSYIQCLKRAEGGGVVKYQ